MRVRARTLAVVATVATVAGLLLTGSAQAAKPTYTNAQIAAMTQDQQAALLNPLRRVADAVDAVGRTTAAGYYAGVVLDPNHGAVLVHLTDLSRKGALLSAARRRDEGIDTGLIRFAGARYTRKALGEARDKVYEQRAALGLDLESIVVPPTGTGLEVRVRDLAGGAARLSSLAAGSAELFGVGVTLKPAIEGSDKSRRRDTPAWIAGAALSKSWQSEGHWCTSGIPARRNSDNRSYLITAAHCYGSGETVYTSFENGGRNEIGRVAAVNDWWDAVAVDTTSSGWTASRVWEGSQDGGRTRTISGIRYSYQGDWVCQTGFTSGQVCDIHVINQDITWTGSDGKNHRGVEAAKDTPGDAIRDGDSGGPVWAYTGDTRQLRGLNSWGGYSYIRWTEATDILNSFGMHLP